MAAFLEGALDWVRPLVQSKAWDYCIIWKFGNDPSRFIEWGSCCCSGADRVLENIEFVDGGSGLERNECKDTCFKHLVRTKACQALARLPSYLPLYSGIHGEVVVTKQPEWICRGNVSASDNELTGTQVLIPIACGLIELFTANHVPKNPKIIDYIYTRFRVSTKQESIFGDSHDYVNYVDKWSPTNFIPPMSQTYLEGSSTDSCLPSDPVLAIMKPKRISRKWADSSSIISWKRSLKSWQTAENGQYKSKNLVTERNRRKRIKDGIFTLRALVPNISKMNRLATLGDAAAYIEELLEIIEHYENELQEMEVDHCGKIYGKNVEEKAPAFNLSAGQSGANENKPAEARVEVSQLGTKDFLLKLVCKVRRSGFSMLMEAMDSLGLQVIDVNVTTFNGSVSNVLRVQANHMEIEPKTLKNSLIQLLS
ncbi:transcription factor bHLH90-like [Primulina eburnea]|uniref:transcription factor bHLH90-like n=1 Tax=Primulina eburnea TaxID=1245227 RepID=UPI003C6C7E2F